MDYNLELTSALLMLKNHNRGAPSNRGASSVVTGIGHSQATP